jgi:hypothetical protein
VQRHQDLAEDVDAQLQMFGDLTLVHLAFLLDGLEDQAFQHAIGYAALLEGLGLFGAKQTVVAARQPINVHR